MTRAWWLVVSCLGCHAAEHPAPTVAPAPAIAAPAPAPAPAPIAAAPADAPAKPIDAAPPATSGATVVAGKRVHPSHLVADANGAYWIEEGDDAFAIMHVTPTSAPQTILAKQPGHAYELAISGASVYFIAEHGESIDLFKMPTRGGRPSRVRAGVGMSRLAIDASGIYIGGSGGDVDKLATGASKWKKIAGSVEYSFMSQIAVDATSVYFSNELDDTPKRIYRVAKTGGDVHRVDWASKMGSWGVSGAFVYYDDQDALFQVPREGSDEPKPVRLRAGSLVAITADRLYYTDGGHLGERMLASGAERPLPVTLGDDITGSAFAAGTLWLVRVPDATGDEPTAEILAWTSP